MAPAAGRSAIHRSNRELTNAWARSQRGWRRFFAAFARRRARGLVILTLIFAVLAGALLPPAIALANALRDYQELRSLGESAVQHLLAAKADTERMAAPAMSFLQPQATPQAATPYTLLVQRQAGTFYPFQATIHPSPQLTQQGYTVDVPCHGNRRGYPPAVRVVHPPARQSQAPRPVGRRHLRQRPRERQDPVNPLAPAMPARYSI